MLEPSPPGPPRRPNRTPASGMMTTIAAPTPATNHPATPRRAEVPSLTSIRGVLALWVVLYHFWDDIDRLVPSARALSPLMRAGWLAVPGFFILSGYVLALNYAEKFTTLTARSYRKFLLVRLARIYPVHLATLLVVLAMVAVSRKRGLPIDPLGYSARDFVLNLLLIQTWVPHFRLNWNYPSWSISSEWFAYLLFPPFCAVVFRRLTTAPRAALALAVFAGLMLLAYRLPASAFRGLVIVVRTFLAGVAIHAYLRHRPLGVKVPRFAPEALMLAGAAAPFVLPPENAVMTILVTSLVVIFGLAAQGTRGLAFWAWRPVWLLGEVSYSLYMTHTLAQKIVNVVLKSERFEHAPPTTRVAVLATYAAMVAAFTAGSYLLVERPARTRLRHLAAKLE
jgi:peptidoglycan/LPS O-acetylase OafA/YrhL